MPRTLLALLASLTMALALTACGSDPEAESSSQVRTAGNGDKYNGADVEFASQMIPHHAQALQLVDLTVGREVSPEIETLAAQIRDAQAPEIEQLSRWLTDWGKEVPATGRDHVNSGHDMDMGAQGDLPGMMTSKQLDDLADKSGSAFERAWLEMMIQHHEGAIEMAKAQKSDGHFGGAVAMAGDIATSQKAEIEQLRDLLSEQRSP